MSNEFTATQPPPQPQEDRTAAILSYLTLIGFVVAIVIHSQKKTALGAFHLRQMLGFIIVSLVAWIAVFLTALVFAFIPFIGPIISFLLWAAFGVGGFVFWLMGLIAAIQGRQTPVPLIGEPIQKWFANTFT